MAGQRPVTPREMMNIVGVGEITFRKYGRSFLDLISFHVSGEEKRKEERI
jgi:hypothetical protein